MAKAAEKTGLGRKLAIGGTIAAGVAGLGYGGYKLAKKKNKEKSFSHATYEFLTPKNAEILRKTRDNLAKMIRKERVFDPKKGRSAASTENARRLLSSSKSISERFGDLLEKNQRKRGIDSMDYVNNANRALRRGQKLKYNKDDMKFLAETREAADRYDKGVAARN